MKDIIDYQERYKEQGFEKYQVYYRRKKILESIRECHAKKILEIGVGMEPLFDYIDFFDEYCFFEPANDFYNNAMKIASDNNIDERIIGINDYFKYSSDLSNKEYDFIVCSSLLHEVENPLGLVKDMVKLCGDKTVVHINVPNANSFHRILAVKMGLIDNTKVFSERNNLLGQYRVFDMEELVDLVNQAGLVIKNSGGILVKPFTHEQMQNMLNNKILSEQVLDGLYAMSNDYPEISSEIYVECVKK